MNRSPVRTARLGCALALMIPATLDQLAQEGLRYNNCHTTALCSPTRAALKSGRNHHAVNMAFITEMATGLPGATGQIPDAAAPLAETLRLNGYATAAWEASMAGPFDRWPTRQGFDKFYGFLGGETNQWAPFLYDGTAVVELPHAPHHVPKEWIARWKGKFDHGWDKMREETLARQIKMGVVPLGTRLAPSW